MRGWSIDVRGRLGSFESEVSFSYGGETVVIVGPNGAGKSMLLKMLVGAVKPRAGRILLGDRRLFDTERAVDLPPEERRIGYVPQGYGLFPHMSVLENVAFGLIGRHERREARER